jgi:hypothetical protein
MFKRGLAEYYICGENQWKETASTLSPSAFELSEKNNKESKKAGKDKFLFSSFPYCCREGWNPVVGFRPGL